MGGQADLARPLTHSGSGTVCFPFSSSIGKMSKAASKAMMKSLMLLRPSFFPGQ
jgi:hypothetical protein